MIQHGLKNTTNTKIDELKLFTIKHELLQIYVGLQTAFAAETHVVEGDWLEEHVNVVKLLMLHIESRMPTISRTGVQHLVPLKIFIKKKASK
jgi:hypothetical protein